MGTPNEVFPDLINKESEIGVRVPQVTEFASKAKDRFKGSTPVTLDEAVKGYK